MSWMLVFRVPARLEIAEASDWYDAQARGLGGDFLRDIEMAFGRLRENPYQYQIVRGDLRRVTLKKFPYSVIYSVSDGEVAILACAHGSRDPRQWQDRV
jgi:plasmid stabilization system protein ParE